ncbi:hypothetical protein BKA70DRAFT_1105024 [Coprinopsis sp. MPI-PUGE-AT-0042]|nr:hypothetical protein BKA70DRAFT_1105024 [Coprinopsis sp. MPI-PUGE-AT-0042]
MKDHKEYFWDVVRFKVANTRFQLPLYRFVEESEYFATEYKLWADVSKDGLATDDHVIELDVDLGDFECFLKVFLPRSPTTYHTRPTLIQAEWISVLKLSTKWRFNELRKVAIEALHSSSGEGPSLSSMELAILAKESDVQTWLLNGYEGLIQEMLSLEREQGKEVEEWKEEEVAKIGSDVLIELQRIVIGRCLSMLTNVPVREVREDIMGSRLLKGEYDAMKSRAGRYLTVGDLREIEEGKSRKIDEARKREEEEDKTRKRVSEAGELEATKKTLEAAQALFDAEKKRNDQAELEVEKPADEATCPCQLHGCAGKDAPGSSSFRAQIAQAIIEGAPPSTNVASQSPPPPTVSSQPSESPNSQPSSHYGGFGGPVPSSQTSASPYGTFSTTPNSAPTSSGFIAVPSAAKPTGPTPETKPSPPEKPLFVVSSGPRKQDPSAGF